jgi:lysophospholipase L1-like esterase
MRRLILVTGALLFVSGLLAGQAYLEWVNRPCNNPQWLVEKACLYKPPMGSDTFVAGRQAFAGLRLNLHAWHGFQGLMLREPGRFDELSFRFLLGDQAYLCLIYATDGGTLKGIRISRNARFPSISFEATPEGEFLRKEPLAIGDVEAEEWNTALSINDHPVSFKVEQINTIGFRGGMAKVLVDDVSARRADGSVFTEDFSAHRNRLIVFAAACSALMLFALGLWVLLGRRGVGNRERMLSLLTAHLVLMIVAFLTLLYVHFATFFYPNVTPRAEDDWVSRRTAGIVQDLKQELADGPEDARIILFAGTSQMYGTGALHQGDEIHCQVQKLLNARQKAGGPYRCLAAGFPGSNCARILNDLPPLLVPSVEAVVINLGNNDMGRDSFAEDLGKLLDLVKARHLRVVLVLEANSIEQWREELPSHPIMRGVAREHDVPVANLHAWLRSRYDQGFLWWDFVHLTSYGQQLAAELIAEALDKTPSP